MANIYNIIFAQGLDYTAKDTSQLRQFQTTIYNNFCLLSWLIPHYQIRVIDQILLDQIWKIRIFKKGSDQHTFYLLERRKDNFIYYSIGQYGYAITQAFINRAIETARKDQCIYAQFSSDCNLDSFRITIYCKTFVSAGLCFHQVFVHQQNDIQDTYNYFKPPCKKPNRLIRQHNDIEYYYIQPESRRHYQPQGYHLNLAFQGGGAKGVSYVGAKKAIDGLQHRIRGESEHKIELPVRSVIGSSAGGILSLAISSGLAHQDLMQICHMMDTLVEDKLIPTQHLSEELLNPINQKYSQSIESQFFGQQQLAIKNMLHNLGLVQQNLSTLLFETLKQPSVQDKLFQLFAQLNPTIASLLSYKEPYQRGRGESVRNCLGSCCCCFYKDCCGCYPCCKATPCSTCFIISSQQYKKVNVYGLLYAGLMTGEAVQNIIAYALSLFLQMQANKNSQKLCNLARLKKWFSCVDDAIILHQIKRNAFQLRRGYKQRLNSCDQRYLQNILIRYSKQITLKQYYYLNGVQFTCTSVDLQDRVQRFFNHKTTPNLPVYKAVQMTGCFPVAFLSLQWKKQWGKYYIHYDRTRREIDLTGHHFTDGGLLANFPLKYLDNQKFRQKYFSHKSVEGKTILYGFGLQEMQDFPQNDKSHKIKERLNNFLQEFKYRIMYRLALYLMRCGSTRTLQIKQVKLFEFLLSLVEALRQSDRNLNKECFKYEIIHTVITKKAIQYKQDLRFIKLPLTNFINSLDSTIRAHFFKDREQLVNDELTSVYQGFMRFDQSCRRGNQNVNQMFNKRLTWSQIQEIQRRIQNNILVYSKRCIEVYQRKRYQLTKKYNSTDVFMTSSTLHHEYQILGILYSLKECLMNQPESQFLYMKQMMQKNCNEYYRRFISIYEGVLQSLDQQDDHLQRQTIIKQQEVICLLNIKYKLSPYVLDMFNNIDQVSQLQFSTPIINFYIEEDVYLRKDKIRTYIDNQISQKKAQFQLQSRRTNKEVTNKLHILFQASYFSHYYYTDYIKIVQQVIADKDIKIDIISCTSYHAIFGVFYLLGYDPSTIKRRMYEIQYLFQENQNIGEVYESKEWMKTSIQQIRTIISRQWERQIDPFELVQYQSNLMGEQLTENFSIHDDIANHIQMDQQYINAAFEKVIDYISSSFEEVSRLSREQRKDRFDQLLSLGRYKKINRQKSEAGQRIVSIFLKYTINLMMITAEHIFKNEHFGLFSTKKWKRETIFKGMVISSLINAFKYRIYIYDILNRAGLDRNITLSKFYQVCERKIILNFNCTNTSQKRFSLINKITKPNMPLWAALMACASLPYLQGQFQSQRQWENKQRGDIKLQNAHSFFKRCEGVSTQNNYISGNAISTLPIQLITNQRLIRSKLTEAQSNTIQIVFAFDSQFHKSNKPTNSQQQNRQESLNKQAQLTTLFNQLPRKMQGRRIFIGFFDILGYFLQGICQSCSTFGLDYFKDLLDRIGTLKMLDVKRSAHDKLILNLYYDSLIKLPARIGTLDFYKINKCNPGLQDAVMQASQVVRQICDTIRVNPLDKRQLQTQTLSRTTIQVTNHKCDIYNHERKLMQIQRQFYRIKFISYTRWRDFKYKYFIQYSIDVNSSSLRRVEWIKLREDYIDLPNALLANNQYRILLRFTYYQSHLISRIYMVSLKALRLLQIDNARAIFSLNYRQIYSAQQPLQLYHQVNPILEKIVVKSHFIPRNSRYCSNHECSAQKLEYVLMKEEYLSCYSCSGEHLLSGRSCQNGTYDASLIAMRCLKCHKNYCLKCKINNFITKKFTNIKQDTYHYECPKNQEITNSQKQIYEVGRAPIVYKYLGQARGTIKNNCLYCQKYSNKLIYEREIIKGNKAWSEFCGLRICEICVHYNVS